jgi:hypothetical protein
MKKESRATQLAGFIAEYTTAIGALASEENRTTVNLSSRRFPFAHSAP